MDSFYLKYAKVNANKRYDNQFVNEHLRTQPQRAFTQATNDTKVIYRVSSR